jgi:hypothetical protein
MSMRERQLGACGEAGRTADDELDARRDTVIHHFIPVLTRMGLLDLLLYRFIASGIPYIQQYTIVTPFTSHLLLGWVLT